jgi:hypothetical protein
VQKNVNALLGIKDPSSEILLPEAKDPTKPTLVISLEEFLIHRSDQTGALLVRPHFAEFLEAASKFYEIVIYSESDIAVITR